MIINEMKYHYNDIGIIPCVTSIIEHRSECNPFIDVVESIDGKITSRKALPIFTAPMSTVVNIDNFTLYSDNYIIPILPRNIDINLRINYIKIGKWVALSMDEFVNLFIRNEWDFDTYPFVNVLIDIANGHMKQLIDNVHKAKSIPLNKRKFFSIMVGNVANPETYYELSIAGADYVRMSIGSGDGCITSTQTGIHYPIASLINETYNIKKKHNLKTKIIADGGIRDYKDVIKALVLGADYVMIGGLLSKLVESAAPTFYYGSDNQSIYEISPFENNIVDCGNNTFSINGEYTVNNLHKIFYGMASRKGQQDISGGKHKTSEGIEKIFECTTNIYKWSENMISYIRTAMSYTNCKDITKLNPEHVNCCIMSEESVKSINK